MVKRAVDVVFSALLLCLSLPILLLSALIIAISSPGPVLFRQTRMGQGFRPFEILKLRTMAHAEAGLAYTLGADPRITGFGRWLRRTKIDELPQLWNVLRGEMSLVGPRPVLPELTTEFRFHYTLLLRSRPGLTDPASLKYSQEAQLLARSADPMRFFKTVVTPDKINLSLNYMEHASLASDVKTLLMTGLIVCVPRLGRVYGQTPRPNMRSAQAATGKPLPVAVQAPSMQAATDQALSRLDACLFSHALAEMQASEERAAPQVHVPWNLLPETSRGRNSTVVGAKRSASGL